MISSRLTHFWSVEGNWNTSFQIVRWNQTRNLPFKWQLTGFCTLLLWDCRQTKYKFQSKGQVNEHVTAYVLQHLQLSLISVERNKHEYFTPSRTLWTHHFSIFRLFILSYFSLVVLCPGCSMHQPEPGRSRWTLPTWRECVTKRERN